MEQALTDLKETLSAQTGGEPHPSVVHLGGGKPSVAPESNVAARAAAADPNDPNSFDVRGAASGGNNSYWTGMQLAIAARVCDVTQPTCSDDTDRFTTNLTIDPGRGATRFTWSGSAYFPTTGAFENKHLHLWAINRGNVINDEDTGDISVDSNATCRTRSTCPGMCSRAP